MGVTQHKHSIATVREITNLQLLFGQLGKPGAGLCPVRGHSNVRGNRTMGIDEKSPKALLDSTSATLTSPPIARWATTRWKRSKRCCAAK